MSTGRNSINLGDVSFNGLVRRIVSLPVRMIGDISRTINHGFDLIGIGGRRNQYHHSQQPLNPFPTHTVPEEWAFLTVFEQQYGTVHPFFYACRFIDAMNIAQEEHKLLFMYIHSPEHSFSPSFCRETLCSEVTVQFLDANFVCWGGIAGRGEGLQMATTLRVSGFPFCAVVAPVPGDNMAVLQHMEGPVTPAELIGILQRTMEEQGSASGNGWAEQLTEKTMADCRLREEQDAAYQQSLRTDREKERFENKIPNKEKAKPASTMAGASQKTKVETTQILIRFPNGDRREQSFKSTEKIKAIYQYIDSLNIVEAGNYKLISNFPRKVYGFDQMGLKLKDCGLHPKATIFLEMF